MLNIKCPDLYHEMYILPVFDVALEKLKQSYEMYPNVSNADAPA